ncbi:MAG: fructose-6-phosphate aldolase [Bacilli bacterium]|jgi:transaldolase|nr:fructose-6-phosphate aldolase [Bacilli bacterium]MCH4210696.1 fructose-6-phosphate aldolase [Bacilli bacterium]MCH4229051.1 fructose-6-phosphate aldolase [Bacilli bacterium]MCH4278131.1 fructose-6-phosphate aldolase [Bacilli bacterium]
MKLFIDTANIEDIREMASYGIVAGVTTNPSLIAREGRKLEDVIKEIVSLVNGPISAEVTEGKCEDMVAEARVLVKIHKNIVIKLPMTWDGIKACKILTDEGIKTNVTLCFSVSQAVLAMEAGATYVSPFMGRLDDAGMDSERLIEDIATVRDNFGYKTQIISASIRSLHHIEVAALAGSDVATIPYAVFKKMIEHPLTTAGLKIFADAAKK